MNLKFLFLFLFSLTPSLSSTFALPYNAIPDRNIRYPSGTKVYTKLSKNNADKREKRVLKETLRGNIPDYLRNLKEIVINEKLASGQKVKAKIWVTGDYVSIGKDSDFVRTPMSPVTAQHIADHYGFILPTTKIVDLIYEQADIKLEPITFTPNSSMVSTGKYLQHNELIEKQLEGKKHNTLIAGHKKDVVLTNRLNHKAEKVAIYGWHRLNGKAIQPLSLVHGNYYADYSHGIRLVSNTVEINGESHPIEFVLKDPNMSKILSYEGALRFTRYRTEEDFVR